MATPFDEQIDIVDKQIQETEKELTRKGISADDKRYFRDKEKQLREEKRQLRELQILLLRQRAGPPAAHRRLLKDQAATLRKWPGAAVDGAWELCYSDGKKVLYVGRGPVEKLLTWAKAAASADKSALADEPPPVVVITGLVTSGKSYTQQHVVPAAVAKVLDEQGDEGRLSGMVVLRLDASLLGRSSGAIEMLRDLLKYLLMWVETEGVPVQESVRQAAANALAQYSGRTDYGIIGRHIQRFLKAVEVPVLVLCDEVQDLFLPTFGTELDEEGAVYMRDSFMKHLLVSGSPTMLWCITGSSMAQAWISIADMPTNGTALIFDANTWAVHLPSSYSDAEVDLVWEHLQQELGRLDPLLRQQCARSIALLSLIARRWARGGRPQDVAAFVRAFIGQEVVEESRKEWWVGLANLPQSQRRLLRGLASPTIGAKLDVGLDLDMELHIGLKHCLMPHLAPAAGGRWYLRDSYQRQILALLFNEDGSQRTTFSAEDLDLVQGNAKLVMLSLGEAASVLLGPGAQDGVGERVELEAFRAELQGLASKVAGKLESAAGAAGAAGAAVAAGAAGAAGRKQARQARGKRSRPGAGGRRGRQAAGAAGGGGGAWRGRELWVQQPWFQAVLQSRYNSAIRERFNSNPEPWDSDLAMLVLYLRLCRNVITHRKSGANGAEALADASVIGGLPTVLGQTPWDFFDVAAMTLALLSSTAYTDAKRAIEEEEEESTGGSMGGGEGSGDGSLSGGSGGGSHIGGQGPSAVAGRAPAPPSSAAGCGRPVPLACSAGRRGVWGQGALRAATLAPRTRVQRSLAAPPASGLRLL